MIASAVYTLLSIVACVIGLLNVRRAQSARWIAAWCTLLMAGNLGSLTAMMLGQNNHWMGYAYLLLATIAIAGAARIQLKRQPTLRAATLIAAALTIAACAILTMSVESVREFSGYALPIHYLFVSFVGIALVASSFRDRELSPALNAAAWIGVGLVLSHLPTIAMHPVARALYRTSPDEIVMSWAGTMWLQGLGLVPIIVAFASRRIEWTA